MADITMQLSTLYSIMDRPMYEYYGFKLLRMPVLTDALYQDALHGQDIASRIRYTEECMQAIIDEYKGIEEASRDLGKRIFYQECTPKELKNLACVRRLVIFSYALEIITGNELKTANLPTAIQEAFGDMQFVQTIHKLGMPGLKD